MFNNIHNVFKLLSSGICTSVITDTSNTILSIFKEDYTNYPDLLNVLTELDLIYKLQIINNFIILIPKKIQKLKCINIMIHGIKYIINNIYNILITIINIINKHKLKYLNFLRKINYKQNLLDLKRNSILLNTRFNILLNILKVIK